MQESVASNHAEISRLKEYIGSMQVWVGPGMAFTDTNDWCVQSILTKSENELKVANDRLNNAEVRLATVKSRPSVVFPHCYAGS